MAFKTSPVLSVLCLGARFSQIFTVSLAKALPGAAAEHGLSV